MNDILNTILHRKAQEVQQRQRQQPLHELQAQIKTLPPPRGFAAALQTTIAANKPAVIAEIKKASPSKGLIREHFDPQAIARSYQAGGAACLSVLTDHDFFQGHEQDLQHARAACTLPVLRKDFIVDPWQLYESRCLGADCVLLIIAALSDRQLVEMSILAQQLQLDVLLEAHDKRELGRALQLPHGLIGINNRNLRSFEVSLETSLTLKSAVPEERMIISESGILTATDVQRLRQAGIHAFLVGEAFMRAEHPGQALQQLFFNT